MKSLPFLFAFLLTIGNLANAQNRSFDPKLIGTYRDADPKANPINLTEIELALNGVLHFTYPKELINSNTAQINNLEISADGSMAMAMWTLGRAKNLKVKINFTKDKAGIGDTMVITDALTNQAIGMYKRVLPNSGKK